MSTSDDDRIPFRIPALARSDNYAVRSRSAASALLGKNLLAFVNCDESTITTAADKAKVGKCFAVIYNSLSTVVASSLPAVYADPFDPKPSQLWAHLKRSYSALVGARQAALVQELFRTTVAEGENPSDVLARLLSSHVQLASGDEKISDSVLSYAMTSALPESWSTQKQNLCMEFPLTSEKVMAAVRGEWDRRRTDGGTAQTVALSAKQQFACTLHRTNGHTNAQCIKQRGTPPASYVPKVRQPSIPAALTASASAAIVDDILLQVRPTQATCVYQQGSLVPIEVLSEKSYQIFGQEFDETSSPIPRLVSHRIVPTTSTGPVLLLSHASCATIGPPHPYSACTCPSHSPHLLDRPRGADPGVQLVTSPAARPFRLM